jgi:hypothetical protein
MSTALMLSWRKPILSEVNEDALVLPLQGCSSHRLSYALMLLLGAWGIIIIIFTAIDFSRGGRSPYTSTDYTNKNKYT